MKSIQSACLITGAALFANFPVPSEAGPQAGSALRKKAEILDEEVLTAKESADRVCRRLKTVDSLTNCTQSLKDVHGRCAQRNRNNSRDTTVTRSRGCRLFNLRRRITT